MRKKETVITTLTLPEGYPTSYYAHAWDKALRDTGYVDPKKGLLIPIHSITFAYVVAKPRNIFHKLFGLYPVARRLYTIEKIGVRHYIGSSEKNEPYDFVIWISEDELGKLLRRSPVAFGGLSGEVSKKYLRQKGMPYFSYENTMTLGDDNKWREAIQLSLFAANIVEIKVEQTLPVPEFA